MNWGAAAAPTASPPAPPAPAAYQDCRVFSTPYRNRGEGQLLVRHSPATLEGSNKAAAAGAEAARRANDT